MFAQAVWWYGENYRPVSMKTFSEKRNFLPTPWGAGGAKIYTFVIFEGKT